MWSHTPRRQTCTSSHNPEPQRHACRQNCLRGQEAPLAASALASANASELAGFEALGAYEATNATQIVSFTVPTLNHTLDGWLLDHWHLGSSAYDALFVDSFSSAAQVIHGFLGQ